MKSVDIIGLHNFFIVLVFIFKALDVSLKECFNSPAFLTKRDQLIIIFYN